MATPEDKYYTVFQVSVKKYGSKESVLDKQYVKNDSTPDYESAAKKALKAFFDKNFVWSKDNYVAYVQIAKVNDYHYYGIPYESLKKRD